MYGRHTENRIGKKLFPQLFHCDKFVDEAVKREVHSLKKKAKKEKEISNVKEHVV